MSVNNSQATSKSHDSNFFVIYMLVTFVLGCLCGSLNQSTEEKQKPKPGVTVLWLENGSGSLRVRVEPEDAETMKSLKAYLNKFPGAKVQGHSTDQ